MLAQTDFQELLSRRAANAEVMRDAAGGLINIFAVPPAVALLKAFKLGELARGKRFDGVSTAAFRVAAKKAILAPLK
jgi:hypothetical protein